MGKIDGGLRSLFRQHLPQFDWCTIESGATGGGIPDSNYCTPPRSLIGRAAGGNGIEGWIEYKQTTGHAVTLRPEQIGWILRRVRCGGRVFVAVRQQAPAGPRRAARDVLWLIPGGLAKEAKVGGLVAIRDLPGVCMWHDGPSAWYWDDVARVLVD